MSSLLNTTFTAKIDKNILTFIKVKCLKILREYFCLPDCKQEPNKLMYGGISVVPRGNPWYTDLLYSAPARLYHYWHQTPMEQLHVNSPENMFPVDFYISSFHFEAHSVSQMILLWSSKVFCFHLWLACKGLLWSVALRINCLLSISAPDMSLQLTTPYHTRPNQTKP